jgi:hypothetical protein
MEVCNICNKKISKMKIKKHLLYKCLYEYKYLFEITTKFKYYIVSNDITLQKMMNFINKYIIKDIYVNGHLYLKNHNANYSFSKYYDDVFCNYENENIFDMLTWETNKYTGEGDYEYYSPDTEKYNSNVNISELNLISNNKFEYIIDTKEFLDIKLLHINDYPNKSINNKIKIIWHNYTE